MNDLEINSDFQDYVTRLLDDGNFHKMMILSSLSVQPGVDAHVAQLMNSINEDWNNNQQVLHRMKRRLQAILSLDNSCAEWTEKLLSVDYCALAEEASEFPETMDNYTRVEWLNNRLVLAIKIVGELGCPTLMVSIDDFMARARFRLFEEEFLALMKQKHPQKFTDIPGYNNRLLLQKANKPDLDKEWHIYLEKFDGFFSTLFFQEKVTARDLLILAQEYRDIPMNDADNCRTRALWILRKFGQNIFCINGTLVPLINSTPSGDSVPDWNMQSGLRRGVDGFICSNNLHISAIRSKESVLAAEFSREKAVWGFGLAAFGRVPLLGLTPQ